MKAMFILNILILISSALCAQGFENEDQEMIKFLQDNELIYDPIKNAGNVTNILEKSLPEEAYTLAQMDDFYDFTHDFNSWMTIYHDIQKSYFDSLKLLPAFDLYQNLLTKIENYEYEGTTWDEIVKLPFALTIHEINKFQPNVLESGLITEENNQIFENGSPDEIYASFIMKSAAVLEQGCGDFPIGELHYDEDFISLGDNIELVSLMIDVGNGLQALNAEHPIIEYARTTDSLKATAHIVYNMDGEEIEDQISFYLTKLVNDLESSGNGNSSRSTPLNLFDGQKYELTVANGMKFKFGILYGCNNVEKKLKRPVIFIPPYRPGIQVVFSLRKYYKKYNAIDQWIQYLIAKDYDVIIVREKSGYESIEYAGEGLASFIKFINGFKAYNYPNEDWENIIFGFSAGGQHVRYALMQLEKEHMELGGMHHHTRLYGAYDSPHLGGNIPMSAQAVYHDWRFNSLLARIAWTALTDAASSDMLRNHIEDNISNGSSGDKIITASPHIYRTNLVNEFNNNFIHTYTHSTDMRRSFPTFSRNIAVSTGSYKEDYNDHSGLTPGMTLFRQVSAIPFIHAERNLLSVKYGYQQSVYNREISHWPHFFSIKRNYKVNYHQEFDGTNGGWQPTFYEGIGGGSVTILKLPSTKPIPYVSFKFYRGHLNFMPLASALAINESIWSSGASPFYDPYANDLMFQNNTLNSKYYGYPHIGHPSDHFEITPFEAVYADNGTYRHIDMTKSINKPADGLYRLRKFLMNEIEADGVALQNKVIGHNNQVGSSHIYKAWYKAKDLIVIGNNVTNKMEPGDYVINEDGAITVYAKNSVQLYPGFLAENGSYFSAYIHYDGDCDLELQSKPINSEEAIRMIEQKPSLINKASPSENSELSVFPNPTTGVVTIKSDEINNEILEITNIQGEIVHKERLDGRDPFIIDLSIYGKGVFILRVQNEIEKKSARVIVL